MTLFKAATTIGCLALAGVSLAPAILQAQRAPVNLGTAGNYTVLAETGITDVPPSRIAGNIGASPITGAAVHLTCAEVTGTISVVDAAGPAPCSLIVPAALTQAINDMQTAYTTAAGLTLPDFVNLGAGNISGMTLAPGLYKWSTGVSINSSVTLSGGPNAVWVFQIAGDLLLANNVQILLSGGAQANNVFWQVGGPTAVTIGTGSVFNGTILSAKQVIMNTGATLVGRALAQTQVTLQSTGVTSPGPLVNGIPVPVGPTVSSTVPVSFATSVAVGNKLTATFSEAMNAATINASTFTLQSSGTPVTGIVTYVGVTATFTPAKALAPNTSFTATITTGAADPAGNALAANYPWTFTTGAGTQTQLPVVTSTAPVSNATSVPVGNALAATFNEPMDPTTINTTTFIVQQGGSLVAGVVSFVGVTATFTPNGNLAANTLFTATISAGAHDLGGNALATSYIWNFTTGTAQDLTPPTVISTAPANGTGSVTVTTNLVANFSKLINPLTINSASFTLQQGTTPISGTVSYAGTAATFVPLVPLTPNTAYTAVITTAVKDLAGNALASAYQWSFVTGTSAGQAPVCVENFAILANFAVIGGGSSLVTGDIGVSPGTSVSGFPPGTLTGTIHAGDSAAAQGMANFISAYGDAVSRSVGPVPVTGDIGGQTLTAGLYNSSSSITISSADLTLDAKGNANAVFVFQAATTLTTAAGRRIVLVNGAQAFNVFWQVGTSATLGTNTVFQGSILANQSITLSQGASVMGRLGSQTGTVSLQGNTVTSPPPGIAAGGTVNAATFGQPVAAGSIAAVFGNDLGSAITAATSYPLLTSLGGSSFQIGAQAAPLYMTSCGQANLQIPWESAGQTQAAVVATVGGLVSLQQPATIAPFAPGIFSLNQVGTGQGVVEIAPTSQLAAPAGPGSGPVPRGAYIAIFCTGLGAVTNQPATGAPAPGSPLAVTTTLPVVTLGGVQAQVTYSGLAPGFAGLYQVNAIVPASVVPGSAVNLYLTIGGVQSNTVTIAVQ